MFDFEYRNPVRIVFGKQSIEKLDRLIDPKQRVLLLYGGGSIKTNDVYDRIMRTLKKHQVVEFGGIEANPRYETLMRAVSLGRENKSDFLLAVGGGSVLDGTKFIAAAMRYGGADPWEILAAGAPVKEALPLGAVLTLPATGSEMNPFAVISRQSTREKLAFESGHVYPKFSILDPQVTYSLPRRQIVNGIVDAFVHVMEQYMTYPVHADLQDRQAEAIWLTLINKADEILTDPPVYDARATLMWCATWALNGAIGCGVPQDWTTHDIGHELTAFYGIDHAESLAIVLPAVLKHQCENKAEKLEQYAERIWGIHTGGSAVKIDRAIAQTVAFFKDLGINTDLHHIDIGSEDLDQIAERMSGRGKKYGERQQIGQKEIREILQLVDR